MKLVGIRRPENGENPEQRLMDNIDTSSTMMTLRTSLKPTDSVLALKGVIKATYSIPEEDDVFIVFSEHIISNEAMLLKEIGISNGSLLTLAICVGDKVRAEKGHFDGMRSSDWSLFVPPPSYVASADSIDPKAVNALFGMFEEEDSEDEGDGNGDDEDEEEEQTEAEDAERRGFDVIMQEEDVLVHRMPICHHDMNPDSLYRFALSSFADHKKTVRCPHRYSASFQCEAEWNYDQIRCVLTKDESADFDLAKLQLLCARNRIEDDCNVQKCPHCNSLYFRNRNPGEIPLEDIKTKKDIETAFKSQCTFCSFVEEKVHEIAVDQPRECEMAHHEDDEAEDIDGNAVNAMFGHFDDEEDGEEEEEEDEDVMPEFEQLVVRKLVNGYCWCCGEGWVSGHICSSSFKEDLCELLSVAETKQIGSVQSVPSLRCCPNPKCCQLITHTEACKHMKCRGCSTDFCFVCLKQKDEKGRWQCGSHSTPCPVAERQDMQSLPDTMVLTKQSFHLYA